MTAQHHYKKQGHDPESIHSSHEMNVQKNTPMGTRELVWTPPLEQGSEKGLGWENKTVLKDSKYWHGFFLASCVVVSVVESAMYFCKQSYLIFNQ